MNISDRNSHPWLTRAFDWGSSYFHASTNHFAFEKVAIQKYLIIAELMKARAYDRVLFLDSDVMLFINATLEQQCTGMCDILLSSRQRMLYSGSASAHTSFWTREAMVAFADFIFDMYTVPRQRQRIIEFWESYQQDARNAGRKPLGGFNDMTLAGWFAQEVLRGRTSQSFTVCNSVGSITTAGIFDYMRGYDSLYGFDQDELDLPILRFQTGINIPMKSVHFQGPGKVVLSNCPINP